VIAHNRNGLLVEARDVKALETSIIDLLNSTEKRLRLGAEARWTVEREFSSDVMCEKYFSLYSELIRQ